MATKTVVPAGGNYGTAGTWSPSGVPNAGDDVVMDATSGNLTMNVNTNVLRSWDMTGYTGTLSSDSHIRLAPASGTVACKFAGTVTWTGGLYLGPEAGATINLDPGGKTLGSIYFESTCAGIIELLGALICGYINMDTGATGTFDINAYTVSCTQLSLGSDSGGTVDLTNATISVAGPVSFDGSNQNVILAGSTVNMVGDGYGLWAQGYIFNVVNFLANTTISCSSTFATFAIDKSGAPTLTIASGTTQTITGTFDAKGDAGHTITFVSDSPGNFYIFSKAGGVVDCDYLSLTDSHASGGASWYAGSHSTNVSGNDGWIWLDAPVYSSFISPISWAYQQRRRAL